MPKLYVIEARRPDGALDLAAPQPESVFGLAAIHGIDHWTMAQAIYRRLPDVTLSGGDIACWPRLLDPRWVARVKTW